MSRIYRGSVVRFLYPTIHKGELRVSRVFSIILTRKHREECELRGDFCRTRIRLEKLEMSDGTTYFVSPDGRIDFSPQELELVQAASKESKSIEPAQAAA